MLRITVIVLIKHLVDRLYLALSSSTPWLSLTPSFVLNVDSVRILVALIDMVDCLGNSVVAWQTMWQGDLLHEATSSMTQSSTVWIMKNSM